MSAALGHGPHHMSDAESLQFLFGMFDIATAEKESAESRGVSAAAAKWEDQLQMITAQIEKHRLSQINSAVAAAYAIPSSAKRDDGGPAFPASEAHGLNNGMPGMSLRDHFASQALPSAVLTPWHDIGYKPKNGLSSIENTARLAYQLADAMLKARTA